MAHMKCRCGASLSNVMCPTENIIYVMSKKRVESALAYNADITLMDFITNWDVLTDSKKVFISEEYDFWYCTTCKRVYQCEMHIGGELMAAYKLAECNSSIDASNLLDMEELLVFSDIEEDNATETEPSIKLSSFINSLNATRYFISGDRQFVYAYNCNAKMVSFVYQTEALLSLEPEDNKVNTGRLINSQN